MNQPNNTITPETKPLTPTQLREALDAWAKEQPGVMTNINHSYGAGLYFPKKNFDKSSPQILHVFDHEVGFAEPSVFTALTCLAIEHRYLPWLQLAATLPYTGGQAARMALEAFDESNDAMAKDLEQLGKLAARLQADEKLSDAGRAAAWRGYLLDFGGYE